jgi:DNA-binding CsgD family transcriptional regulator
MVGRSAELDRVSRLIGSGGGPAIAFVAGEAGIGKTRLVQELVQRVPAGTLLLTGQADPDTASRPMALVTDALASAPTNDDHAGLLAVVRDIDRGADPRIEAATELIRQLAAEHGGAVVVFEDLHWADPESVNVFEELADPVGSGGPPLLLVGTYRPDGLSRRHPAAEMLPRLERRHSVTNLNLQRLGPGDVGNFLGAVYGKLPSFRVVEALHSRTGGNPFFLEELIASSKTMPCEDVEDVPLPWTVAELVEAQVDELEPDVRRIVAAAAELGRRVPFDVLAAVTETDERSLIDILRVAVDKGMLVETEPDVFGFHHEIARETIARGLLGRERRRLHEAALESLRKAGSRDHSALARHALGAGRFDELVEEARLGAVSLLNHGSSYQALQLAECGLGEAEDDPLLLSVAARAAWLSELVEEAEQYSGRWRRVAQDTDDVSEEAGAVSLQMRVAYEIGDIERMGRHANELADLIDRLPTDAERAQAMATLAQSYMLRDKVDPTVEWADKASQLAEQNGLTQVRLAAMVEKGSVLLHDQRTSAEGRKLLEDAIEESERSGEHLLASRAIHNLVWHAFGYASADEVRELIDRRRINADAAGWRATDDDRILAQLAAVEGDLDTAILELGKAQPGHTPQTWKKGRWTSVLRAGFALEAGEIDEAERLTQEARPVTERSAAAVTGLEFHIALRRGDLAAARQHFTELMEAVRVDGYAAPSQVHDLVAVALHAGLTPGELRPLVEFAGTYVDRRLDMDSPWRQLVEAQLAEAEGRTSEAAELYVAASKTLASAPGVLAGARGTVHVGAARMLVALGRREEALTHARAAATRLARWRGWRVEELRAVERRLGIGDEPSGPALLTPRERDVIALLAEGLTNSQLADRLYISPRTAAVHVSNILAKLGMSSRTEVAAWAAGGGLDET